MTTTNPQTTQLITKDEYTKAKEELHSLMLSRFTKAGQAANRTEVEETYSHLFTLVRSYELENGLITEDDLIDF